jgi:hypothetical protein
MITNDTSTDLISLTAPTHLFPRLAKALAAALDEETPLDEEEVPTPPFPSVPSAPATGIWTLDEIQKLKLLIAGNATATALMDLTCAVPNVRITFPEACQEAGRDHGQGRADLAVFSKLIGYEFPEKSGKWPVEWAQESGKGVYYALPYITEAWKR